MSDVQKIDIDTIRAALEKPRPGLDGQARMAPSNRIDPDLYRKGSTDCRRAAVLILLYPYRGELYLLLTVRPDDLPDHPGQVAFPGGARDNNESVVETALREAHEEVGLDPESVEPLGRLTHLYIPPSRFCIQILVAFTPARPVWHINPVEIADLLEIPLAHFLDYNNWKEETRMHRGEMQRVPYFEVDGHKVWGATAMALAEFITMVEQMDPGKQPDV